MTKNLSYMLESIFLTENEDNSEQEKWFLYRTNLHISLVKKAAEKIAEAYPEYEELLDRAEVHDASKFEEPEKTPYVSISWRHKLENEKGEFDPISNKGYKTPGSLAKDDENKATLHHITSNAHHPEYWLKDIEDANINAENRDESDKCVDATKMPDLDIAEMVADWQAMSWELKKNTAKEWFDKQKDVRWHFSPEQEELIYKLLDVFEGDSEVNEDAGGEGAIAPAALSEVDGSPHKFGSCMLWAERKTKELLNQGKSNFKVVEGYVYFGEDKNNKAQHTWIEINGEIVDGTLDQFSRWGFKPKDIHYLSTSKKLYKPEQYLELCKKCPIKEDGEGAIAPTATTQADINYLPAMIGEPQRPLAGKKKKKKIKKVEESIEKTLLDEGVVIVDDPGLGEISKAVKLINPLGSKLRNSSFLQEKDWKKFWVLTDGTVIPVDYAHSDIVRDAAKYLRLKGANYQEAFIVFPLDEHAIAGYIDDYTHALGVQVTEDGEMTDKQLESFKKLALQYQVKQIDFEDRITPLKSPEHFEYVMQYGDAGIEENKMNESILEALQSDMSNVRKELKPALINLYNTSDFKQLDKSVNLWKGRFGAVSYLTKSRDMRSSLVTYETKTRDIQKLYGDILRAYKDDKGYLDMVLEAIQERKPLNTFDVFDKKDFLYGTRIKSNYSGVIMVFEATIDMTYSPAETVLVEDDEVLGFIEEQVLSVKVAGKTLFPNGSRFTPQMLKSIADALDDFENKDFGVKNEEDNRRGNSQLGRS